MKWFTSDTHFGHANVIKYDNRPFSSVEEMNNELIKRWNSCVSDSDHVYHLGDFAWGNKHFAEFILTQLRGKKFLICGNHDSNAVKKIPLWAHVADYMEITEQGQMIVLFHYKMSVWNKSHFGSWALHGHSHGKSNRTFTKKTFDIGSNCWNYTPLSFDQIKEEMNKHTYTGVDGNANL